MPSGLRNGGSAARSFMIGGGGAAFDEAGAGGARFRAGPGGMPMTTAEMVAAAAAAEQQGGAAAGSAAAAAHQQQQQANKGRTKGEMLFGPDVGDETDAEKGWQQQEEAGGGEREDKGGAETSTTVPLDVVKNWVQRAKQEQQDAAAAAAGGEGGVHQTTTIQALVNVKRPTIQLAPLTDGRHAVRFTYDASTPRVRISVTLHEMDVAAAPGSSSATAPPRVVHSSLADGGFGKQWQLPDPDALDLVALVNERKQTLLEAQKRAAEEAAKALRASMESAAESEDLKKGGGGGVGGDSMSAVPQLSNTVLTTTLGDGAAAHTTPTSDGTRPRFGGILGRRQQRQADEEAQIGDAPEAVEMQQQHSQATTSAGAAVSSSTDAAAPSAAAAAAESEAKKEDDLGIKVIVTIEGCDESGSPSPRNSQATHFLITGNAPSATADIASESTTDAAAEPSDAIRPSVEAQRRIWMLRVVRREARIAGHTFLLREIFGLSSASNAETTAASQVTYPPKADEQQVMDDPYASAPNECIVCLTSPRDVVLLPCRHLVVCRDCAVGMIEFGAGGKVARREDAASNDAANGAAATADTPAGGAPGVVGGANPPTPAARETERRRRKKAKGWFCPVCRQPYTSLLRLALPHKAGEEEAGEAAHAHSMHTLSRQPSIAAASMRSLRRTPSRATLPERGERMLTDLQPDEGDDVVQVAAAEPERPQFVLEDESPGREQEPRNQTGWKQVEV